MLTFPVGLLNQIVGAVSIPFSASREGLFHYLGTNSKTTVWTNPLLNNKFVCQLYTSTNTLVATMNSGNLSQFFDRSTSNQYLYHNTGKGGNIRLYLPNKFNLTTFSWRNANVEVNNTEFEIRAWNNPQSFSDAITLFSHTISTAPVANSWDDYSIPNVNFYDNYAYIFKNASNNDKFLRGAEIEFFGNIQL